MAVPKIEKLEELMSNYIGEDKKIVHKEITRLTAPGENFGSEMLKVDLRLKSKEGKEEDLNVVAKLIPENEFARVVFNIQVSFNVEKGFYNSIVPSLQEFQRKEGVQNVIDIFPKLYGARNNLKDESDVVDDDAALILENVKVKGYNNVDRKTGFDLPTAKLIVKNLAQFHAVPIALKQKDPKTFETRVKPYLSCNFSSPQRPPVEGPMQLIYMIMKESINCSRLIPKMEKSVEKFGVFCDEFREPFATIGHRDLWVNNIMVKFDGTSPVDCKFVDFQMYTYDSPAADLFFFLFGSVQLEVLKNSFDDLLKYYHKHFEATLKSLNCDLKFSYQKLLEEISFCTVWELAHTIFMHAFVINGQEGGIPMPKDMNVAPDFFASQIKFEESSKNRVEWILEECDKRGWLNF